MYKGRKSITEHLELTEENILFMQSREDDSYDRF